MMRRFGREIAKIVALTLDLKTAMQGKVTTALTANTAMA